MPYKRQTLDTTSYIYVDRECPFEGSAIQAAMASGFAEVFEYVRAQGIKPLSTPMSLYPEMPRDVLRFRACVQVASEDAARVSGNVKASEIPAGDVFTATHVGPYSHLSLTHKDMWEHMRAAGFEPGELVWEIYIDDPQVVPEDRLRTEIYRTITS